MRMKRIVRILCSLILAAFIAPTTLAYGHTDNPLRCDYPAQFYLTEAEKSFVKSLQSKSSDMTRPQRVDDAFVAHDKWFKLCSAREKGQTYSCIFISEFYRQAGEKSYLWSRGADATEKIEPDPAHPPMTLVEYQRQSYVASKLRETCAKLEK